MITAIVKVKEGNVFPPFVSVIEEFNHNIYKIEMDEKDERCFLEDLYVLLEEYHTSKLLICIDKDQYK